MANDMLDLYARASEWTLTKVRGAVAQLDASTPCDEWNTSELMSHMLDSQQYFLGVAQGLDVSPPPPVPATHLSDEPIADFQQARAEVLGAFGVAGVVDTTGPTLGIAFTDMLLHGWDLARATAQDEAMPEGLAGAAYEMIHGRFTDEQRPGIFKPELVVGEHASPQEKLLAYTGRSSAR